MPRSLTAISLLLVLNALGAAAPVARAAPTTKLPPTAKHTEPPNLERIRSSRIIVNFRLKPGADPLSRIDLYYTLDNCDTWKKAPDTKVIGSPVTFDAPSDGLYGLYLVFHSASGESPLPATGTAPHRWVRVDRTAPIAQILSIKPDRHFSASRAIEIRWRAEDEDFSDRPATIRFREAAGKSFQVIASEQPAEGTVRWIVPGGTTGKVEIKITAVDRTGNRTEYIDDRLVINDEAAELSRARSKVPSNGEVHASSQPSESEDDNSQGGSGEPLDDGIGEPDAGEKPIDPVAAKEAKRQYDLATWHRLRGEPAFAISKYRTALELRPDFKSARNDLAALLCLRGELDAAETEYEKILESDDKHRPALKGLALVQAKKRNYRSAHTTLQKVLLLDPVDADAWVNFGDVSLFMGDRPAARDAWTKAMRVERAPNEIRQRAAKRLEIYKNDNSSSGEMGVSGR